MSHLDFEPPLSTAIASIDGIPHCRLSLSSVAPIPSAPPLNILCRHTIYLCLFKAVLVLLRVFVVGMHLQRRALGRALEVLEADFALDGFGSGVLRTKKKKKCQFRLCQTGGSGVVVGRRVQRTAFNCDVGPFFLSLSARSRFCCAFAPLPMAGDRFGVGLKMELVGFDCDGHSEAR